jgi:RNA polymerase sigma-70 factor (ECF subfamily)
MTGRADAQVAALPGPADESTISLPATVPVVRDAASFEAVVAPLYTSLLRRLVLVLGNVPDAEDVAQDAYLRAFRSWDRFDGADPRAWLYTIALRLGFNQLRRRRRWLGLVGRSEPSPWHDQVDPDLWNALARLDPRSRFAFLANVLDGYTQREIATILGVPEGTVSSWLSRARASIRTELGDGGARG